MTNDSRVCVLGLGAMGSRMAERLRAAGRSVTVWNRGPGPREAMAAAGFEVADTPRAAAEGAGVVVAMVRDDEASRATWGGADGALAGLAPDAVAVEASTLTPGRVRELAEEVAARGGAFVEAPVVGSRPQAEAGQLVTLAAGEASALERARPVLEAWSGRVVPLGEPGRAAVAKLAVNAFFATQVAAAAEAADLLRRAGVADEAWLELLGGLPVTSAPVAAALQGIAAARWSPAFPVELVEKDLGYALATAEELGATRPVTAAVHGLYNAAREAGHGDLNLHAVARVLGTG